MAGLVEGKVALVTGAGGGIGRASAVGLAREGAKVVVSDVKVDGGNETVAMIEAAGGEASFFEADVTDEAQVEAVVAHAVDTFGGLDAAHNNAGITHPSAAFVDLSLEAWEQMIAVNLTSVFLCMKHELLHMQDHGGGVIVNTASGAAVVPAPGQPHYTAAKRGVVGLTAHAADEYKGRGIRVVAVSPGMVDTPMLRSWMDVSPEIAAATKAAAPGGELIPPEGIGEVVVFLCSDRAAWVSGDSLLIDAGMVCR